MADHPFHVVIPYAVNFGVVVVLLAVLLRKPLRKFLYQRHERMKDAFESAAVAHQKALARAEMARKSVAQIQQEEQKILQDERQFAENEKRDILEKASQEAKRIGLETDRLAQVEQEEASEGVKQKFLALVVKETEESLKRNLKKDDHSAILKRAQSSIEVGV